MPAGTARHLGTDSLFDPAEEFPIRLSSISARSELPLAAGSMGASTATEITRGDPMKATLFWGYVVVGGVMLVAATIAAVIDTRERGCRLTLSELGTLVALWLTYLVITLSGVPQ